MASEPTINKASDQAETEVANKETAKDRRSEQPSADGIGESPEAPAAGAQAETREISEDELRQILNEHATWLASTGKGGSQADLRRADLHGVDLTDANLEGADLRGAKLQEADLLRTNLRDANLADADLSSAKGLLAEQLAGANLSRAKLPEAVARFDALKHVAEQSQLAKRLFTVLLLGCIYALLTVATTEDVNLLTNSASSPLPVIQTEVPIAGFYFAAPVILVGLYLYFLLYLQRLWELLAKLPAVFPDGTPLNQKAYPWLMNGMVLSHFKLLREKPPPLSGAQAFIAIASAYWVVPITLVFVWGRYLPRHEWWGTSLHLYFLVLALVSAILLYRLATRTLRAERRKAFRWRHIYRDRRAYGVLALALAWSGVWGVLSYGAIEGHHPHRDPDLGWVSPPTAQVSKLSPTVWVPRAFKLVSYRPYFDFTEANISAKPATWTGEKETEEMARVAGARLAGADLRYVYAPRAFLAKTELTNADLRGADLQYSNLYAADLTSANLHAADLTSANLQGADLTSANLQGALLIGADLTKADLQRANLQGARLFVANLRGSKLFLANLQEADLRIADLDGSLLLGANLRNADCSSSNLQWAILSDVNLEGTNLEGADIRWADFRKDKIAADLSVAAEIVASGPQPEQVKAARNWDLAFYEDHLLPKLGLLADHNETLMKKREEFRKQTEQDREERNKKLQQEIQQLRKQTEDEAATTGTR